MKAFPSCSASNCTFVVIAGIERTWLSYPNCHQQLKWSSNAFLPDIRYPASSVLTRIFSGTFCSSVWSGLTSIGIKIRMPNRFFIITYRFVRRKHLWFASSTDTNPYLCATLPIHLEISHSSETDRTDCTHPCLLQKPNNCYRWWLHIYFVLFIQIWIHKDSIFPPLG